MTSRPSSRFVMNSSTRPSPSVTSCVTSTPAIRLYSALNSLGRVQGLPVIDDAVLDPDADYRIRTRAMLNMQQYPAALRILFFWRGQWQLESEWFEWLLER